MNLGYNRDQLFNMAKIINTAQYQKIVMKDWLPYVVSKRVYDQLVGNYTGEDSNVDPRITN